MKIKPVLSSNSDYDDHKRRWQCRDCGTVVGVYGKYDGMVAVLEPENVCDYCGAEQDWSGIYVLPYLPPHWDIFDTGARCSVCDGRVRVKALTGKNYTDWDSMKDAYEHIRYKFCPFCGSYMMGDK